jgi:hypothetical protein
MIQLLAFPPYPISSLYLFISLYVLSPVEHDWRERGAGGGRGASSYDREKPALQHYLKGTLGLATKQTGE